MKTIQESTDSLFNKLSGSVQGSINPEDEIVLEAHLKEVRDEAFDEAEKIARRDGYTETADKIAALRTLP